MGTTYWLERAEAEMRDLGGAVGLEDNARPSPIRGSLLDREASEDMAVLERCGFWAAT